VSIVAAAIASPLAVPARGDHHHGALDVVLRAQQAGPAGQDADVERARRDELDPSIEVLRADGFEVDAFAYPFGVRTGQLDAYRIVCITRLCKVGSAYENGRISRRSMASYEDKTTLQQVRWVIQVC